MQRCDYYDDESLPEQTLVFEAEKMVELICRNEPKHFFCLYNILRLFTIGVKMDVKSIYKSMNMDQKCLAFTSGYCPVTDNGKPCALLRRSHDSIIREQLYALEALKFIRRERGTRKLLFNVTSLGRNAVKNLPVLLPSDKMSDGKYETDLSNRSAQSWVRYCRKGLELYGP